MKQLNGEWKRKQLTTGGADPTVVTVWKFEAEAIAVEITEFQSIVQLEIDGKVRGGGNSRELALQQWAEFTFSALEAAHDMKVDAEAEARMDAECDMYEREGCPGQGLPSDFHGGEN